MCNDTEFFNLNACFRARFVTDSNEADSADANAKIGFRFEYWTIPCPCENDAECTGDVDRCDSGKCMCGENTSCQGRTDTCTG